MTASIAWPWLRLRRVPVTVERPSSHAAIVRFDYGVTPAIASAVGISRSPLREWHSFATVKTPGQPGYRLLDLPRRRLDRPVHRRSAVAPVGPRRPDVGADGQGRGPVRARRLRRHRQRDRTVPRADPGGPRRGAARVVRAQPARHLRRRPRRPGGGGAARRGDLGHGAAREARPRAARARRRTRTSTPKPSSWSATRPRRGASSTASSAWASRPSGRSGTPDRARFGWPYHRRRRWYG